jgi:hypothetical protein
MIATSHSALEFAVSRLRWCLNKPLVCGGRDWGACVYRALQRLGDAFEQHVDFLEASDGPLAQLADPTLLPFTQEAHRVRDLRDWHTQLREQIQIVTHQFRDALLLFPCDSVVPEDAIADARAYRLYGVLGSCATDLLHAVEACQKEEALLLWGKRDNSNSFALTKIAATVSPNQSGSLDVGTTE